MAKESPLDLGKRERQIVETVYRLGEASVTEVLGQLPNPPSYSAVRAMLGILVEKGALKFRRDGKRYLYRPAMAKEKARRSVLRNLLATFFGGCPQAAMVALLEISADDLSDEDLDQLRRMIEKARKEDR